MGKPFEYHTEAIAESRAAYRWYAEQSVDAAERFWRELVRARESVQLNPKTWTPYYAGTRVFQLRKFPYGLVYLEHEDLIVGVAVCHLHRKPGYWLDRIESTQ